MALPWGAFVVPCDQGSPGLGNGAGVCAETTRDDARPIQEQRPAESHAAYRYYAARLARKAASGEEPEVTRVPRPGAS